MPGKWRKLGSGKGVICYFMSYTSHDSFGFQCFFLVSVWSEIRDYMFKHVVYTRPHDTGSRLCSGGCPLHIPQTDDVQMTKSMQINALIRTPQEVEWSLVWRIFTLRRNVCVSRVVRAICLFVF